MKMYRHELVTNYPLWDAAQSTVCITEDQKNPFYMVTMEEEVAKIQKDADKIKQYSIGKGGDGITYTGGWCFRVTKSELEGLASEGISVIKQYDYENDVTVKPSTVDDFIKLRMRGIVIPDQKYSVIEIELDDVFKDVVDSYERNAQRSWSFNNPEPYCQKQYSLAMRYAENDLEREYVVSRAWC